MDFFEHQDEARKASRWLVLYFALAVAAIAVSVHLAASGVLYWYRAESLDPSFSWWSLDRFVFFAGGTLLIVLTGSLYKVWRLSEGGGSVAVLLGGRPLDPNTTDPLERRVRNVVEEMALASGTPVPTIFVLDAERSINAFAAGYSPHDAVVGVTRGALELLTRDELQGVIAHEFSHILNGDMHLNLRLMGVLHGILVMALLGYFLLRVSLHGSGRRRGNAAAALPLIGLALVVIGYIGVVFGRLIKSAVSRQREFLADASSVQFTRNPLGIAGVLKKIGGLTEGSLIVSPHAEQASHFFFSGYKDGKVRQALAGAMRFDFLATHPPLKERIRRIEPRWDGVFPDVETVPVRIEAEGDRKVRQDGKQEAARRFFTALPVQLTALIGTLDQDHLEYSRDMLERIPDRVREAVHEPASARAVVLATMAGRDPAVRAEQLQHVARTADEPLLEETKSMLALLEGAPRETRLPLVDLAMPALRRLSPEQYVAFMAVVDGFIRADEQIDLFEYTLTHVLRRHLEPTFKRARPPRIEYYGLNALGRECSALLSAIAHAGHKDERQARRAFEDGARELEGVSLELHSRDRAGLTGVRDALEKLEKVSPKLKRDLMRALVASAAHDGRVTIGEGELLRAIADALGLPVPPFLPGQAIAAPAVAR